MAPAVTATVRAKGAPYQRPGPGGAPRAHLLPPCLLRAPDSSGGGAGGTPQGQEGLLLGDIIPSRGSFSGLLLGASSSKPSPHSPPGFRESWWSRFKLQGVATGPPPLVAQGLQERGHRPQSQVLNSIRCFYVACLKCS